MFLSDSKQVTARKNAARDIARREARAQQTAAREKRHEWERDECWIPWRAVHSKHYALNDESYEVREALRNSKKAEKFVCKHFKYTACREDRAPADAYYTKKQNPYKRIYVDVKLGAAKPGTQIHIWTGLKQLTRVGPEGHFWFLNRVDKTMYRIDQPFVKEAFEQSRERRDKAQRDQLFALYISLARKEFNKKGLHWNPMEESQIKP